MTKRIPVALVVLLVAACGPSPEAATEENLAAALQEFFDGDANVACLPIPGMSAPPVELEDDASNRGSIERYDAFVAAGLMDGADTTVERKSFAGLQAIEEQRPARRYTFTDEGRQLFQNRLGAVGGAPCFLYGRTQIEVLDFSKPTERTGKTVSEVTFRRWAEATQQWVRTARVREVFSRPLERLAEPRDDRIMVAFTENGWEVSISDKPIE